ncbi:sigma-54-dependent Fis family transcriptional regulator [Affinibrenneria salicis]|uniref:Sigma-54-dependent Fis family transcriptional regulator n=1 Tax=Affinibrenneria salicis TaxID=2590031 RepID=A0A5J5FTW1_9GAMM|nr:sigma-54-dependent Fis family transcriptional regulator [Affinibrenneria salicis]KAA8996644.1 sigma-54-dependent Fis family transcriptional regulator [Affinibrenneria salicis]
MPQAKGDQAQYGGPGDGDRLPGPLTDSWQRSRRYGLSRDDEAIPDVPSAMLKDAREQNSWIFHIARPLFTRLAADRVKQNAILVMSDATGLVLETCGKNDFLPQAERVALSPGNLWGEHARGTNAIGTALALHTSCEVTGAEHFLNQNAGLFCSAAPVFRPDGQIAGVLDLSSPAQHPHRGADRLIGQTARYIEHHWVKSTVSPQRWMLCLHSDDRMLGSAQELVLVFADNVLMAANKLAMNEFRLAPHHFGVRRLEALFAHAPSEAELQTLQAGNERRYYATRTAPGQRYFALRPAAAPFEENGINKEKALRILNAGIALCITGETGCGKEHFSRRLYETSKWRDGQFVAINCAALPENLIESELFGYLPGAFTGANPKGYIGKLREADGGVLFLDEIGDMPIAMQTRLLRVLQEKTVTPLGGSAAFPVNFALICATHRDLPAQVRAGEFREDLLYRIEEYRLHIPPLREWTQVARLIHRLWRELGAERRDVTLPDEVVRHLTRHPWPGNVRQLLSVLKVVLALADDGDIISLADLPDQQDTRQSAPQTRRGKLDEREAIRAANGNMSLAAKKLGISRSTLYRRLEKTNCRPG